MSLPHPELYGFLTACGPAIVRVSDDAFLVVVSALREYVVHHHERNHQGKENLLLFPASEELHQSEGKVRSRERLGGLLRFYHREAA